MNFKTIWKCRVPVTRGMEMRKQNLGLIALEKICLDVLRGAPGYETLEKVEVRAVPRDRHDHTWQLKSIHPDHSVGRKWAPFKLKLQELQQAFDLDDT